MGFIRRKAYTLREQVSFLFFLCPFMHPSLCIGKAAGTASWLDPVQLLPTIMEPRYKGIAEIQWAGEVELDSILDLQVDHRHLRLNF